MGVQKIPPVKATKATVLSKPANRGTEEKFQVLIEHYAKNGCVRRACEEAEIHHSMHYRRLQSDATYRAAFEEAEQEVAQEVEDVVYKLAVSGEAWAATLILKRFRPNLYRERASLEVSGSIDLVERMQAAEQRLRTFEGALA